MHKIAKNNIYTLVVLACLVLSSCGLQNTDSPSKTPQSNISPAPIIKVDKGPKSKEVNQQWIELLHQSNGDLDWREVEYQNTLRKLSKKEQAETRSAGTVDISGGKLIGNWQEMGPTNLAGDIKRVAYSKRQNRIYAISAGNTLWKGKLDGSEWIIVDDTRRFDYDLLEVVDLPNGGTRIIAAINNIPHFSEDGNLWSTATGFNQNSKTEQMVHTSQNEVFILAKQSDNGSVQLLKSVGPSGSEGKEYELVKQFGTTNFSDIAIALDQNQTNLYLVELIPSQSNIRTYFWSRPNQELILTSTYGNASFNHFTEDKAKLMAETLGEFVILSIIGKNKKTYRSQSSGSIQQIGNSWIPHADLKEKTWWDAACITRNSVYIQGREECYYSIDGASSWKKINFWQEYYADPVNKLHIDIMHIREFEREVGPNFVLICTHGGIYYTENIETGVTNISLSGLNVSQLYDVVTVPDDPKWIFTGSQDQGWQKGRIGSDPPPVEFEQIYHGDYGHILINDDYGLWISFPNGLIRYYNNAFSPFPETGQNLPNAEVDLASQSPVWISPLMLHPDPAFGNTILVAGGSIQSNNDGSYLVQLRESNGIIEQYQIPFDFSISGGDISAMATDPNNIENWYVATTNGKFFYSSNGGDNFTMSTPDVPGGNNLYGSDILVSQQNPGTIYVAGSGYSNAPVLRSTDGGISFTDFSEGLPPTTVFELAFNEKENVIFAAAEAGAFVYLRATERWYDLSQLVAPNQRYWSVQYIDSIETARFGTYGRGVWDFTIEQLSDNKEINNLASEVNIYPNPSSESFRIQTDIFGNISHFDVYSLDGTFIFGAEITTPLDEISVSTLAPGAYVVRLKHSEGYIFKKIVKI